MLRLDPIFFLLLACALTVLLLGLFVFFRNRQRTVNQIFLVLSLSMSSWILTSALADVFLSEKVALIAAELAIVGPFFFSTFFFFFAYKFPVESKISKKIYISTYLLLAVALFLVPTRLNIEKFSLESWGANYSPGYLYTLLLVHFVFFVGSGIRHLRKIQKSLSGQQRAQVRLVSTGVFFVLGIGIITNLLLPLTGYSRGSVFGPAGSLFFIGFTTYAIIKHQLLDIKVVITRSLIYGLLLSSVTISIIFISFFSAQYFNNTIGGQYAGSFVVATLIVFGLEPFKRLLSRVTDQIFFKAKIDYQLAVRKLTEVISTEIDIDNLIERLASNLTSELKINKAILILKEEGSDLDQEIYQVRSAEHPNTPSFQIDGGSPLIKFLKEKHHATVLEALKRRIEDTRNEGAKKELGESRSEFEKLGASVIAPVEAQGQLNAILALGPKLSGDSYSNEDLNLVAVLGPQIGSAIEKAKLYERVKEFSESLQDKVEAATSELQERNVSLVTLQSITKEITRTLDFNKVAQEIANSVTNELGYLGAILVLLDEDGHTARARAVTETALTKRALKLLPKHFSEYPSDLSDPKYQNMEAHVLRTGELKVTEKMSDIVSPPLPKTLANAIQKLMGIKTIFAIPIVSENKVIGVIEVGTKRNRQEVKETEVATLQSVADQLGVVARNIKLFDQIRSTNEKLAEANRHLQALDQAKSEFVSIASHQLRTPMTGIKGYLSMLVGGDFGALKPEHGKILKDLLAESERMIRLINLFLNVSKIEAGKFTIDLEPASIEVIVEREVKELVKQAHDKGLKLSFERPKQPLPSINVDADKLQDVLLNLVDNAIKYTHAGTVVVSIKEDEQGITVMVKDSGIGIDPEEAKDLFNKFVRGSGIAQIHPDGSGLGLFIAKRIVEAHGGRIWVESEGRGKGSSFQFFLPKHAPQGRFEVGEETVTAKTPLSANAT